MVEILYQFATVSPSGLAAETVTVEGSPDYGELADPGFRIASMDIYPTGSLTGEGEFAVVGIANSDLNATEITESLKTIYTTPQQVIEREQARRPIFPMFHIVKESDAAGGLPSVIGPFHRFKVNKTFLDGWHWFVYNPNTSNIATGGAMKVFCKIYGVWV